MSNWWSIIKFDPVGIYITAAIKDFVRNKPDATDDEILEHISDLANIYNDPFAMLREEDKRVGTMEDIDRFNEGHKRGKYSGETVLSDYQKDVVLPAIREVVNKRKSESHGAALMGTALQRELEKLPQINKNTIEEDIKIINRFFSENDKYKDLRTLETVLTEEGNPDFVATEKRRKEQLAERLAERGKTTLEELKERLKIKRKKEAERQKRVDRGGYFD